jgi:hypothetical protein
MEQRIKEANINYYDHNEIINIEEIEIDGVYKANWKRGGKLITLKSFKLDDDNIKEVAHEVCKVFFLKNCVILKKRHIVHYLV